MTIRVFLGIEDAAPTHLSKGVTERLDEKNAPDLNHSQRACVASAFHQSMSEGARELASLAPGMTLKGLASMISNLLATRKALVVGLSSVIHVPLCDWSLFLTGDQSLIGIWQGLQLWMDIKMTHVTIRLDQVCKICQCFSQLVLLRERERERVMLTSYHF